VRAKARQLYSASQVEQVITGMVQAIAQRLAGRDPVIVALMHGGAFLANELCKRFEFPYRFDYVHVTRYGAGVDGGEIDWRVLPSVELAGRTVLLVDDILDRGTTLAAVQAALRRIEVGALYTAVLVEKDVVKRDVRPEVDFVGLHVPDRYVFGSGMDYKGYWRFLPGLYAVEPP
jgi:hypoxanthine phosphoribosyltransferase